MIILTQKSEKTAPLLFQAFHEEYSRLYELSQEETTPQEDARLQHALVYFFQNKAPKRIIERTLLEQFTDRNLSFDERYARMTHHLLGLILASYIGSSFKNDKHDNTENYWMALTL